MKRYALLGSTAICLGTFTYVASAQYQPKPKPTPIVRSEEDGGISNRYFRYAASNIPHVSKRQKGGEDAWVATPSLLVVADGVGGWANRGIDPGKFSK